jgi:hypothetical protein
VLSEKSGCILHSHTAMKGCVIVLRFFNTAAQPLTHRVLVLTVYIAGLENGSGLGLFSD